MSIERGHKLFRDLAKAAAGKDHQCFGENPTFYIPTVSTADSKPAPQAYCVRCNASAVGNIDVRKVDNMLEVWNMTNHTIRLHGFYGPERVLGSRGRAIYSHGRFFSDRAAAELSLSQGETYEHND